MTADYNDQSFTETKVHGERLFRGRVLQVDKDTVRLPNGQEATREVVRHPGAVALVAVRNEEILLVRQFRYAVASDLLEIPAGKLDHGELPAACAERELREETGYRGTLIPMGIFYTTPGFSDEAMHIFLARDLVWDPLNLDEDEFLEVCSMSLDEAAERARQGGFRDGKTALGILMAAARGWQ